MGLQHPDRQFKSVCRLSRKEALILVIKGIRASLFDEFYLLTIVLRDEIYVWGNG